MRFFQRRTETVRPCGCGPRGSSLGTQWRGRGVGETTGAHRGGPHTNCGLRAPKSALGEPKAPGKGGGRPDARPQPTYPPRRCRSHTTAAPRCRQALNPRPVSHTSPPQGLRQPVRLDPAATPHAGEKKQRSVAVQAARRSQAVRRSGKGVPAPPGAGTGRGMGGAPDLPHCKDPGAQAGCSRGAASRLQVQASQPWRRRDPARGGPGSPHTHPRSSQRQL